MMIKIYFRLRLVFTLCEWQDNVAYVSQQAWVQQGTLRDNICFGRAYEEKRFSKVVYACALERDLEQLPGRDLTELGGKVPKTLLTIFLPRDPTQSAAIPQSIVCPSVRDV